MDLSTKEIEETSEEWMWWQGETSFDMRREENPLAIARCGLGLPFRQPPRPLRFQPVGDEALEVVHQDRRGDPIPLDPARR